MMHRGYLSLAALWLAIGCSPPSPNPGGGGSATTTTSTASTAGASASSARDASGTSISGGTSVSGGTGVAGGTSPSTGGSTTTDAAISHSHAGPLGIMTVGDSITYSTCWRSILWQHLNQSFPSQFHFVGTLDSRPSGCSFSGYEGATQSYASSLITEAVNNVTNMRTCTPICPAMSDLTAAFDAVKPDVVLLHWGTNDVWNVVSATAIVNAYSTVVDALRAANPNVIVFVAQIIPMNVTASTCSGCSCVTCPTAVPALDTKIAAWAPTKSTAASPVIVVDQYDGFDAVADTKDGVHPTDTTGSQKMADKWYAALATLF